MNKVTIELNKYYKIGVIYPAIVVIIFNVLYGMILVLTDDSTSEWLSIEMAYFGSIIGVLLNFVLISILSLTIYLNKYDQICKNIFLSLLSWLLLPSIWIAFILNKHVHYVLNYQSKFGSENIYVLSNTIPFILTLIFTFLKYRSELKKITV